MFRRKCANPVCKNVFVVDKPRATVVYCSDCRNKNEATRKQNIEAYQNRNTTRICYNCGETETINDVHVPNTYLCSKCVADPTRKNLTVYKRKCNVCGTIIETKKKLATVVKCDKCKNVKLKTIERESRLFRVCRECNTEFEVTSTKSRKAVCNNCRNKNVVERPKFAKRTHFGYYGIASDGHKWNSLHEQDIEEWLIENKIQHKPHPQILKSPKHADQFIPSKNLYLEIDGLSREKDYEWYGKIELYNNLNLDMKIIKPVSTHFKDNKDQCFKELDIILSFLKVG